MSSEYSQHFVHIIKSLQPAQFRTVCLGHSVDSVLAKEAGNELQKGNIYMPYVCFFVDVVPGGGKQQFDVSYMYQTDRVDHIQFSMTYRENDGGLSREAFATICGDFVRYLEQAYGAAAEKGKNSLGSRGREVYQLWRSKHETHALRITLVTHLKPKEKEATYLQVTFAGDEG